VRRVHVTSMEKEGTTCIQRVMKKKRSGVDVLKQIFLACFLSTSTSNMHVRHRVCEIKQ
jgi:hypothetical protein